MPAWQQLATWGWLPLPGGALWRRGPNDCKHASARAQGSNVFRHLATRPRRTPCTEAAIVLTRDESHLVAVQGNGAIDLAQLLSANGELKIDTGILFDGLDETCGEVLRSCLWGHSSHEKLFASFSGRPLLEAPNGR